MYCYVGESLHVCGRGDVELAAITRGTCIARVGFRACVVGSVLSESLNPSPRPSKHRFPGLSANQTALHHRNSAACICNSSIFCLALALTSCGDDACACPCACFLALPLPRLPAPAVLMRRGLLRLIPPRASHTTNNPANHLATLLCS